MREPLTGKFIGVWCLLMLSLPLAIAWIQPDFEARQGFAAISKLAIALAVVSGAGLVLVYAVIRRYAMLLDQFTDFIGALPTQEKDLPVEGPAEIQNLSRSMKGMAERVRLVVEQANIEASRRETILACMAEGVLAVDSNLNLIFCNQAFAETFSIRTPVTEGRSLYEVVREPMLRDILQRVLGSEIPETDRFQLPSAAGRWFEARALPFGQMNRRGAVIVLHDITDIQAQERMRKDFVADVSHELRTPLAAIRGYAETLLDGALEDEGNNRRFVEIILSQSVRLNNIAADLLVLSELDSGNEAPLVPDRISLLDVVQSAVNTVAPAATLRNVMIDQALCEPCTVMGVRFRLEQVMVNLLDNAVKFNRPEGTVTVQCGYSTDRTVNIRVSDTGIGIPNNDVKRIFERFYRVDKARSRPAGGTGLGLPIVKEVVVRMGGTVSVESQLGRGSSFIITLPAA